MSFGGLLRYEKNPEKVRMVLNVISIGRPIQRVNKYPKSGSFLDIPKLSHFYSRFFFLHKLSVISEHHSGGILKMLDDI